MLTLLLKVTSPGGRQKFIRALVDTGAQVNLVRNGLFSCDEFQRANSPLTLVAANGQVLEGGKSTIELRMKFYQSSEVTEVQSEVELDGEFFEANIGIDAILSYPWCKKHHLAGVPHLKCLAKVQPNLILVYGEKRHRLGKVQSSTINCVQIGKQSYLPKYRLQKWVMHTAWDYFHQRPDIDVFADAQRHECPVWWGPGGNCEDPFQQNWGTSGILWMNPAPHLLERVVDKIALDKAKVMLVCPRWINRKYWFEVQPMAVSWYDFHPGAPIFRGYKKHQSNVIGAPVFFFWMAVYSIPLFWRKLREDNLRNSRIFP